MTGHRFTVLDALSRSGAATRPNDDAYGVARQAVFVLDGATGVGPPLLPGESDAEWVAVEAAASLAGRADDPALDMQALIGATIRDLENRFLARRTRAPEAPYEVPFASMMLLRQESGGLEAAWFGDCRMLIAGEDRGFADLGPDDDRRTRETERARRHGDASMKPRDETLAQMRRLRNHVNTAVGYGLLGPDPRASALLARRAIAAAPPLTALLMSDGFYALSCDYRRYSAKGLMQAALGGGLAALYEELRGVEASDSRGEVYPRFKAHDDATAVLVQVE